MSTTLIILHYNIQCLSNKMGLLESSLADNKYVLLCLNEHWLKPFQLEKSIIGDFFLVSGFGRSVHGHGLSEHRLASGDFNVYLKKKISTSYA